MKKQAKRKILSVFMIILLLFFTCMCVETKETMKHTEKKMVVAIDPGHGGFDPGKVGIMNSLEKDINLAISLKVRKRLEKEGISVIMTRLTDEAICCPEDRNKKITDMRNRVDIINSGNATLAVSIHQNSFTSGSSRGAQVFFYTGSKEGEQLAKEIQNSIKEVLKDGNKRVEKANSDYYLLRKVTCPIVIVECGFLSNPEEEMLLQEEDYQEKIAEGIYKGIVTLYGQA